MPAARPDFPAGTDLVLGVERSFAGRPWRFRVGDEREALALAQATGLDAVTARVLVGRGLSIETVDRFLNPSLRADMPDPARLKDMERAAARLADAVIAGEEIAVFGDYDVDGATSAAVLIRYFKALRRPLRLYVPDRQREGYGPNVAALEFLAREGVRLVIAVDCGTLAFQPFEAARAAGLEIIVSDHHQAEPLLPAVHALVNPNRLDDESGLGHLAAVGVTFLLVVALNRDLRRRGFFGDGAPPDLMALLDLVALGTVADVVPLTGLNRTFVTQGLKVMAARGNAGIAALMDVARVDTAPTAYHLGYLLGPRVNAGGRVGQADLGAQLLATDDPEFATALAARLDALNRERQAIEKEVEAAAVEAVESRLARGNGVGPLVLAAGAGWHPGVVGIVASRLKERYRRPTFVLSIIEDGRAKGSGRSIPGIDLGAAVAAARATGLIDEGGGHAMAAGITVPTARLDDLEHFWAGRFETLVEHALARDGLKIDAAIGLAGISGDLVARLAQVAPFGQGNPEPRFVLPAVRIAHAAPMGKGHLRLRLEDAGGRSAEAVAFRSGDGAVVEGLAAAAARGAPVHLAGHVRAEIWQGRSRLRLMIEDAADAAGL
ncbi:single-stranded-DNA-specific exonuclease RecJ [Zavarzinia compransoris]|uniref:Single-stranded-DNA-specific exonuclease RecJ n=2 Tax=Zavarzinia compransoris TaxID=1264899 RepID=A0A317ECU1_9PROT|nr:single-stranded-DNA-specific exonuclease RecJ [Zavarzinia compransoris]PWR24086.1 single-stranded-DNA-specific exonuclease RecJ [Zavarzinia compransoris]